ncbi:MAG: response regulator transcription factor [Melioribacteraceae bacterium]|nr:response regulator transcription factor [Melioribacteraceae bacterium]MCF8396118.1 response regulator transcription factor [Melioribacteraceae bacterium]MCF8421095.1 response regulator transcription factor [Melioribacteraceae bacterium]
MINEKITFLLVDDHPMFRAGVKQTLEETFKKSTILEAESISSAQDVINSNSIDLIFLDINLPDGNGLEFLRKLNNEKKPVKVIMLTMYDSNELFHEALELGTDGYLTKDSSDDEIKVAVNSILKGHRYISSSLTEKLIAKKTEEEDTKSIIASLTPTEKKILRFVSELKTSKEIGEKLFIHYRTVENHRTNICVKLGLKGNNALLKFAIQNKGLI